MSEPTLNEILAKIKTTDFVNIYVPSLKHEVPFKPLTLLQQRNIIDKVSNTGYGLVDFFLNVNEIIKANCADSTVYAKLNTIDRINIVVSLRKTLSQTFQNVNLQQLIDKNKTVTIPSLDHIVESEKFYFEISAPTLVEDTKFNTFLITNFRDERQLLGKLLVCEVCKFVNKITALDSNTTFDLSNQSVKNKWSIIEALESKNLKPIFDYITSIRNCEEEFVKLEDTQIDIGPELFIL